MISPTVSLFLSVGGHVGDLILELLDHQQVILDVKFAPDGSLRLASCSADGRVKLWDLTDDGNMYKTLQARGYRGPVYACAWAPDAQALVMVGQMGMVCTAAVMGA